MKIKAESALHRPNPRSLKENASAATINYAHACTKRALKLFQIEMRVEATSFKHIDMKKFWPWLASTPSLSQSTKNTYARSVCRVLKITPIKLEVPIIQRSKPTKDLFIKIKEELDLPSGSFISDESNNAFNIFILMATTGVNISSRLSFTIASENKSTGKALGNYDLSIETINTSFKKQIIEIHEVPWDYHSCIKAGIGYLNRLNKEPEHEIKKTKARLRYFIQRKLSNHGHTITSTRRSFPSILGYLK